MQPDQPKAEPSVMGRLNETLGYLATLERHCSDMDGSLFGKGQSQPDDPHGVPTTLEGMMADACERAAALCGWVATIKNRLGCVDSLESASVSKNIAQGLQNRR